MFPDHLLWLVSSTTEVHSYSEEGYLQNSTQERRGGSLWTWHKLGFSGTMGLGEFSLACSTSCLTCYRTAYRKKGRDGQEKKGGIYKTNRERQQYTNSMLHLYLITKNTPFALFYVLTLPVCAGW